ncbi:MAG: hypothetical protein IPL27_14600 [Lewinellaceae bacterium]|nr:hypothetical protein [Lewinellaceae bacterium]
MRLLLATLCAIGCICPASSQRLEHHDLLLFSLTQNADSSWLPNAPRFLTKFNPKGYNNQPAFFSDNELYLTVQFPADTTQTDLVALDLGSLTQTRVTATPLTAEYSPTLMPGGRRFSCIRVEEDGSQRLWSFPIDRSDNGRPEFPNIYGIGYHCWLRDTLAAFFIVGENGAPHTLQVAGTRAQKPQRIASNIGRCLLRTASGQLAFVTKTTEQTWFLKTWNPQHNQQEIVVKMPTGSEDFTILPDGTYVTGSGPRLFQYKPGRQTDWKEIANLSQYGVKKITRLGSAKNKKLVVVVE